MITESKDGSLTITGAQDISLYALLATRAKLKLEMVGMKSRGGSTFAMVKRTWSLKGSKESVLVQFQAIIDKAKSER